MARIKVEVIRTVNQVQVVGIEIGNLDINNEEDFEEIERLAREEADEQHDWSTGSSEYDFNIVE